MANGLNSAGCSPLRASRSRPWPPGRRRAQFMSSPFPVIIVPPPRAGLVIPKAECRNASTGQPAEPPLPDAGIDQSKCYHGRENVCR